MQKTKKFLIWIVTITFSLMVFNIASAHACSCSRPLASGLVFPKDGSTVPADSVVLHRFSSIRLVQPRFEGKHNIVKGSSTQVTLGVRKFTPIKLEANSSYTVETERYGSTGKRWESIATFYTGGKKDDTSPKAPDITKAQFHHYRKDGAACFSGEPYVKVQLKNAPRDHIYLVWRQNGHKKINYNETPDFFVSSYKNQLTIGRSSICSSWDDSLKKSSRYVFGIKAMHSSGNVSESPTEIKLRGRPPIRYREGPR